MTDLDTEYKLLQMEIKKLSIQMENMPVMAKGYKELLRKEVNLTKKCKSSLIGWLRSNVEGGTFLD